MLESTNLQIPALMTASFPRPEQSVFADDAYTPTE